MHPSSKFKFANLGSPIFLRIAAGVFICILLIEAILLIHSWSNERDRLLSQLDGSLVALTSLIDDSNPEPQLERLLASPQNDTKFKVIGYVIGNTETSLISGGNSSGLTTTVNLANPLLFSSKSGLYDTLITASTSNDSTTPIRLRVDASWINAYMKSYVWRILFMIVLISIFVTAGCLLLLTPLLVNPLQRLNQLMVNGREQGIRNVEISAKDISRTDELGSVFHSFNILRKNLIQSEDSRISLQQRSEEFANLGADCFWELDHKLNLTYLSGDVQRLLSIQPEDFVGRHAKTLLSKVSSQVSDLSLIVKSLKLTGNWEGLIHNSAGGEPKAIKIIASTNYSSTGQLAYIRGTIIDVNEQAKLSNKLRYQAAHDELTGLYNRRELSNLLSDQFSNYKNNGTPFCFVVMDLDRFKIINDTCGHAAGDNLIKSIATIITQGVDENDVVARTGGDEFALILTNKNTEQATRILSDIRIAIDDYRFHWENDTFSLTASIGLAETSTDLASTEAIAFAADLCCLEAKKEGKNQIRVYSDADTNTMYRSKDEAHWITKIKSALNDDRFALFKQDIVKIESNVDDGHFEILIRMHEEQGSFCSPGDFLPVAERNGLMPDIDRWVVTQIGHWFSSLTLNSDSNYCVSVNLSPASLANTPFREFLLNWASIHQNYAQFICFEVTESAAMMNLEETIELLEALRNLGCRIALDDFGTGFSSLSHIRNLPLDFIKIDGVFVRNIETNVLDQAVVKSVADIARLLNVATVAEFVETEEMLSVLSDLHIDFAQGYLFSKPEPLKFGAKNIELHNVA